jgi:hypothetical protein
MSTNPMVFIETAPQPSAPAATRGPILLVDPPEAAAAPSTDPPATAVPWALPAPTTEPTAAPAERHQLEAAFRAPTLALVAAVTLIAGYHWLGVIPASGSRLSSLVFDRAGVLVVAVGIALVTLAVTRPGAHGHRPRHHRLMVLISLVVVTASALLAWLPGAGTRHAVGVCDLVLASAIAGVLIIDERRRRQAESSDRLSSSTAGATDRTLPVS